MPRAHANFLGQVLKLDARNSLYADDRARTFHVGEAQDRISRSWFLSSFGTSRFKTRTIAAFTERRTSGTVDENIGLKDVHQV